MTNMLKTRNMNNTKIVNAKQAVVLFLQGHKGETLKTNTAIWFNKIYKINRSTPSYVPIKVNDNNHKIISTKK
jgi:hypothetical protein